MIFTYPGGHDDYHAFPTRRSSDLARLQSVEQSAEALGAVGHATGERRQPHTRHPHVAHVGMSGVRLAALDRKSTRLNSSHGYISYAVFCLKEKDSTS